MNSLNKNHKIKHRTTRNTEQGVGRTLDIIRTTYVFVCSLLIKGDHIFIGMNNDTYFTMLVKLEKYSELFCFKQN